MADPKKEGVTGLDKPLRPLDVFHEGTSGESTVTGHG
jgi:hypothetical protein